MWPVLLVSLALNVAAPASREAHAKAAEIRVATLVGQMRAQHALPPLAAAGDLRGHARRHALRMSAGGSIFHSGPLHPRIGGWTVLGETVGMASRPEDVVRYFLQSPSHRAVLLDPAFDRIGTGVAIRDGTLFVTLLLGSR